MVFFITVIIVTFCKGTNSIQTKEKSTKFGKSRSMGAAF